MQSLNDLVSGGMNISLFFTWVASKLELGSNAHACIHFRTSLVARHEEPLVCPRERGKVRILSRENCLQIIKNVINFSVIT